MPAFRWIEFFFRRPGLKRNCAQGGNDGVEIVVSHTVTFSRRDPRPSDAQIRPTQNRGHAGCPLHQQNIQLRVARSINNVRSEVRCLPRRPTRSGPALALCQANYHCRDRCKREPCSNEIGLTELTALLFECCRIRCVNFESRFVRGKLSASNARINRKGHLL